MYAIKSAGLAIGIGIGSSFIVLVSFVWGIFVFEEAVRSKFMACVAILLMMTGLMGMSYYSSPQAVAPADSIVVEEEGEDGAQLTDTRHQRGFQDAEVEITRTDRRGTLDMLQKIRKRDVQYKGLDTVDDQDAQENGLADLDPSFRQTDRTEPTSCTDTLSDGEMEQDDGDSVGNDEEEPSSSATSADSSSSTILICGIPVSKRHRGMMAAAFCGIWGGSVMAPMKWCKSDTQGTGYLMSFSMGASIITLCLWLIRYLCNVSHYKSFTRAYQSLPPFHLDVMWLPGGTSGLLWSIGNFFSLISVLNLGEGVGYPLSQTSILVSGLWGIFYFKEVTGTEQIFKWIGSSLLTILGILLLSYEHISEEENTR